MGEPAYPAVRDVVPHTGRMVLLTRVVDHAPDHTACVVEIGEDTLFREPDGLVPAWVGLEYMAQCVAAHAGLRARANGEPIRIGLLLGSRRVEVRIAGFAPGQILEVRAQRLWGDWGLGSFACSIQDAADGRLLVDGHLSVYLAQDLDALVGASSP